MAHTQTELDNLAVLAAMVYNLAYPNVDSKQHRKDHQGEIFCWMADGDIRGWTPEQIAAEWLEFNKVIDDEEATS